MKLKRLLLTIFILMFALGLAAFALKQKYFLKESLLNNVEVIWNNNQVFVKLGRRGDGIVDNLVHLTWRQIRSLISFESDKSKEDMIVISITESSIESHVIYGFNSGGGMFPHESEMYYYVGVDRPADWPAIWRWKGSFFQKLPKLEAEQLLKSFPSKDEKIAHEGWHQESLSFTDGKVIVPLFSSNRFSLILEQQSVGPADHRMILLHTNTNQFADNVLVEALGGYKSVGKRVYERFWEK